MTDAMMRSPEEEASREEMLREQYNQQFGQQGRGMGMGGMGNGPVANDKMLRPNSGSRRAPQAPQFNAWDNPNDRGYNMAALRQMMGGF